MPSGGRHRLHNKCWTHEKVIVYLINNTSISVEANTKTIEHYIVMHGQATVYKMSMLKLLKLHEKART